MARVPCGFALAAGRLLIIASTSTRSANERAARACRAGSPAAGWPKPASAGRAVVALGPVGTEAPAVLAPASTTGSTGSNDTACRGSPPVASSHRPSQPVVDGLPGEPVCQMSIDRKWLWSGRAYSTPRTIASRLSLNRPAKPFMPGFSPRVSSRCGTSSGL